MQIFASLVLIKAAEIAVADTDFENQTHLSHSVWPLKVRFTGQDYQPLDFVLDEATVNEDFPHFESAPEGIEATSAAARHAGSIHLLITDLVMPGIGGAELATQLTAMRPNLLVLYISGYPDRRESNLDGSQAGRAYLQKPFTPSQLVRKVREVLDACAS